MDLKRFLLVLAGAWRVLLLFVLLAAAVAAAAFVVQPRTYQSTAQAILTQRPAAGQAMTDGAFADAAVANYARIATTPYVLDRVRERLALQVSRAELVDRVDAVPVAGTAVIEVTARASDARQAADIANAVVAQLGIAARQITPAVQGSPVITVTQVQQAIFARSPIAPSAAMYAALGIATGLVLGIALVVLRELSRPRLRTVRDVEDALDAPVLGVIPPRRRGDSAPIAVLRGTRRPRAEAYRSLRTNTVNLIGHTGARSVVVAGSAGIAAGEAAANLALALGDADRTVLLIDADLHEGRLDELFAVPAGPGLVEVLRDGTDVETVLQRLGDGQVELLPDGGRSDDPSGLLQSPRTASLLRDAEQRYDAVIVAAPGLPAVTDAAVLSGLARATLLVVPSGVARRSEVVAAASAIERAGGRVVGVVLMRRSRARSKPDRGAHAQRSVAPEAVLGT